MGRLVTLCYAAIRSALTELLVVATVATKIPLIRS
jgi:hypothetical protein